jgi:hypothetical protein
LAVWHIAHVSGHGKCSGDRPKNLRQFACDFACIVKLQWFERNVSAGPGLDKGRFNKFIQPRRRSAVGANCAFVTVLPRNTAPRSRADVGAMTDCGHVILARSMLLLYDLQPVPPFPDNDSFVPLSHSP